MTAHPVSQRSRIVVGIDGTEPSLRALRWASRQADLSGAALEVVTAWNFPEHPAPLGLTVHVPFQDQLIREAQDKLDEIIADVLPDDIKHPVTAKVVRGDAAPVLLAEAGDADLLVVGKGGRGTIEKFLMGSVSERCLRRARCPIVVVP